MVGRSRAKEAIVNGLLMDKECEADIAKTMTDRAMLRQLERKVDEAKRWVAHVAGECYADLPLEEALQQLWNEADEWLERAYHEAWEQVGDGEGFYYPSLIVEDMVEMDKYRIREDVYEATDALEELASLRKQLDEARDLATA